MNTASTDTTGKNVDRVDTSSKRTRVGLAIQGGGFPAGAFAAGVMKGLVERGAFNDARYDICAFSGTSAGALVATVCWGHRLNGTTDQISADLERQWTYLTWPEHLAWLLVWTPDIADGWKEVDGLLMKMATWRWIVEHMRTPFFRWVMGHWIADTIPIEALNEALNDALKAAPPASIPGLALGAADVLKGEIKVFRECDLSREALLASGSLDDCNGMTTIVTPPHAGTYLDGAWGDNPPINELLDYRLDEIWFIQHFPKTVETLPRTPAERAARKDQLWQNSLVEHESEFVDFVNEWRKEINAAIQTQAAQARSDFLESDPDQDFKNVFETYTRKRVNCPTTWRGCSIRKTTLNRSSTERSKSKP
ncbi:MAG: hypothetical protein EA405_02250 [Rhodospirillales bacterium]|nr:MAG: hypothetical protein EA405_02250 [Rhodospirillales bacterium]